MLSRLLQHSQRPKREISEWGNSLIFVSSELNKAHIRYIEARMIERATTARQARLINDTKGYELGRLTLEDKAVADRFLDTMVQCLETIGITFLTATPHLEDTTGEYLYEIRRGGIEARGLFDGSAFWVKSGSTASKTTTAGCPSRYKELREQLTREGVLQEQNDHLVFTTDYRFDAPSAAAAVVLGRAANGWKEWRQHGTGKTLDEVNRIGIAEIPTDQDDTI